MQRLPQFGSIEFAPIPLTNLRADTTADFDLLLKNRDGIYLLYRDANTIFTEMHQQTLMENDVEFLFISRGDRQKYARYLETHLGPILEGLVNEDEKATIVYEAASQLMRDVFEAPVQEETIVRVGSLISVALSQVMGGERELVALLDSLAFDYSTYTHSVNVTVLGLALGKRLGFSREELRRLGTGLLLHDIGKSELSQDILLRTESLTVDELEIVKRHPELGHRVLTNLENVDVETLIVVMQHHERCDGSGYPNGLTIDALHPFGHVSAIVDTFDALTTDRVFQDAVDTFTAIRTMMKESTTFCTEYLKEFILMLNLSESSRHRSEHDDRSA